jgi:glycosyltransferase involved in cell wall biosynthesis
MELAYTQPYCEMGKGVINIQFQTAAFDMHPAIHWLPRYVRSAPSVVTFHDLRAPYLFPKAGAVREQLVRKLARDADGVIATDRTDARKLAEEWTISNVEWIPIGSNISTNLPDGYDRNPWRSSMHVSEDDLLVGYFGFLNESKGALVLIEALAKLLADGVPAHLVMIGGRAGSSDPTNLEYGRKVDEAINARGLVDHVRWTGFVQDAEVSAHFLASDIIALPYLDGVSLRRGTLMAGLAHGRAIVTTTPETEAPELDGALLSVAPHDPRALAEAIAALWRNPDQRAVLEAASLQTSKHFTWDSIAQRTIDYFDCICK